MTRRRPFRLPRWLPALTGLLLVASPAAGQVTSPRPWGRISFYTYSSRVTPDGVAPVTSTEFITQVTFQMSDGEGNGLEYGIDMRHAGYLAQGQLSRLSIYDSYAGARVGGGRLRVRAGQMWLTDLGGLGAVAGGLVEFRQAPSTVTPLGRLRVGGFMGVEPNAFQAGFVSGVRKYGVYAAIEGAGARRHVAGYVRIQDRGLLERSVLTFSNFVPAAHSRVFMYQAAEYDLSGPAGQGHGGLTYMMVNTRVSASSRLELQGLYHRGRSIDTRAITDDVLAGRPVPAGAVDGLLYESLGGRATVQITRVLRVNAGFTRDRNNQDSSATGRLTLGVFTQNLARSGIDLTVSDSRITRPAGRYDSLYVSAGRQLGRVVYLSGDYSSSVSIARFTRSDGFTVETRPRTRQLTLSGLVTLGRHWSVLVNGDRTRDVGASEFRLLSGLTYRFQ